MNTTTIHFVQDACQLSSTGQSPYGWPSADHIQQLHCVDPNLFDSGCSSTEKCLLSNLEPIATSIQTVTQSISTTQSISAADLLSSENCQTTYLTPLINVTIGEPMKGPINKLPIAMETDYSQVAFYDHQINGQINGQTSLLNSALPSMAVSFGSPIVTQSASDAINSTSLRSLTSTLTCSVTNSRSNSVAIRNSSAQNPPAGRSLKTNKPPVKANWITCSKPGRKSDKLNEQKLKYSNEFNLNNLNNLSKTIKRVRQRKRLPTNLLNKGAINLSNAPNNLCNLNATYSPSLNQPNNPINSSTSLRSSTTSNPFAPANCVAKSSGSKPRKSKQRNTLEQPENVRKRNYRERMRVTQLNEGFEKLKGKIPLPFAGKKLSKVQTLRTAVEYIRELQKALRGEANAVQQLVSGLLGQSNGTHQSANSLNATNRQLSQLKNATCKSAQLTKPPKLQLLAEPISSQQLLQPIGYYDAY